MRHFTDRLGSDAAAEDVVQDIYLKLCSLDPNLPVHNEAAFLYRLGSNLMLDRLRKQRRAAARDGAWRADRLVEGREVVDEPGADEALSGRQRFVLMLAALEELPAPQRRAFSLHKLENLTQAETAAALGVSLSSVEKYLRAALKHLIERLG